MDWRDTGILLTTRKHGESSVILEVFTPERGRHAGVLRGGASRRMQPHLQPGTQLQLEWHARLEDHLGQYRVEPLRSRAATAMSDRVALAGLNATCAMLAFALPERVAHPRLYESSRNLLDLLLLEACKVTVYEARTGLKLGSASSNALTISPFSSTTTAAWRFCLVNVAATSRQLAVVSTFRTGHVPMTSTALPSMLNVTSGLVGGVLCAAAERLRLGAAMLRIMRRVARMVGQL